MHCGAMDSSGSFRGDAAQIWTFNNPIPKRFGESSTPDLALSNSKVTTTDPLSDGLSDEP